MRRRISVIAILGLSSACLRDPVEWSDTPSGLSPPSAESRLVLDEQSRPAFAPPHGARAPVADAAMCEGSARYARARGDTIHAAWWTRLPNEAIAVVAARSGDGGATWSPAVVVDSTSHDSGECGRFPPDLWADGRSPYVHIVYYLAHAGAPGVFFSHSMDTGEMFHAPVAIVYGDRPVRASVGSWGDTVVVAHEDPNAARPTISLALSYTAGHIFESRQPGPPTSTPATRPIVAVRGRDLVVGWLEGARHVARMGRLR